MISKGFFIALSRWAAAFFAAAMLLSGHFLISVSAYDHTVITGSDATGANISGYESAIAINVEDLGADSTGVEDSTEAIQEALDYARENATDTVQVKVVIPEGTYSLSSTLYISSNTWLYMQGATLRRDFKKGCMIVNLPDNTKGGFDESHSIVIEGGCLDGNTYDGVKAFSHIRMAHLHDLWIKNVDFKDNYNCHHLELGGVRNVTIEDCEFREYSGAMYKEAIQFDIMNNESVFSGFAPFDDTPCDNVIIRNNNFYDVMRGIGSHSATLGVYYTNFLIADNTFNNIYDTGVIMLNYRRCTIENNTMTSVGKGIDLRNMTQLETGYNPPVAGYDGVYDRINDFSDTIIRGNTISAVITDNAPKPFGISLYGKLVKSSVFPDHDYKVEGVLIDSNSITTAGAAIQMTDASGVMLDSNTIGCPADGEKYETDLISLKYSADVTVKNNSLMGSSSNAISVVGGTGSKISGNTCMNSGASGILADKNAKVTIKNNTIENSAQSAIAVRDGSEANIADNTINGSEGSGVAVESATDISATGNSISGCAVAGIFASEDSGVYVDNNSFEENESESYKGSVFAMPVTDLAADGIYGDHVQLSWLSKGGSDGFSVKRRQLGSQEDFEEIAVVNTPSYIDDGLPYETRFEYKVDNLLDTGSSVTESSSDMLTVRTKTPISECTADIKPVYRYCGKKLEPDLTVYLDGNVLQKDIDYKVKFYNNMSVGKATAVISGCGEYFGFKELEFEIKFSEGSTAFGSKSSISTFGAASPDRYELITVVPSQLSVADKRIGKSEASSELLNAIGSAKNNGDMQIYSRRLNTAGGLTGCGLWF